MKQVLQHFKTGVISVEEVPVPILKAGCLLVRNKASLISKGTEGGRVQLGKMSLLGIGVHIYGKPSIVKYVPAESFFPPPKVGSAIIRIDVASI